MTAASKSAFVAACILASCALTASTEVMAQARAELIPTAEIPHGYKSWSLFLICNPAWIVQNGDKGIEELFYQYKAFGGAIGPSHLAIWFWKKPAVTPTADNTDIERSSIYCARYKLLPSDSPHVLLTTRYPDDQDPGDRLVVSLNGLDAHNSALAITKLTDQLLVTGLNQSGLDSGDRWRRVLAAAATAISVAACYFNKVSLELKTSVVSAKIEHSTGNGC